MRAKNKFSKLLFVVCCILITQATQADTPFSQYGVIQNVQNYSSNPFWSPDAPYNQRMPTAIYATGPDVETAECQRIVAGLVTTQCAMRNNCIDSQISDIRPAIMLQLSRMTGGNYATSCAGYIDDTFNEYVQRYGNAVPVGVTAFPHATVANPTATTPDFEIENPYQPQLPDWQSDILERKLELQELQSMNGTNDAGLERAAFPTTYADLSLQERTENAATGYKPYAGKSAYRTMKIEDAQSAAQRSTMAQQNRSAYCNGKKQHYQTLNTDLTTLKKCRDDGVRFADCKSKLKGTYK